MSVQLATCSGCSTVFLMAICRIQKCECGNNVLVPPKPGKVYVDLACCQTITQVSAENEFYECIKCMQTNDIMRMKRTVNGICIYKTIVLDEELPPEAAPITKTYPRSILKKKAFSKGLRVHMRLPTPGTSRDEYNHFIPDDPIDVHHSCKENEKLFKKQVRQLEGNFKAACDELEKMKSDAELMETYVRGKGQELERSKETIRGLTKELEKTQLTVCEKEGLIDSAERKLAISRNHCKKLEVQLEKYRKELEFLKQKRSDQRAEEAAHFFEGKKTKTENPGNLKTIEEVQEDQESKTIGIRRTFWSIMAFAGEVVTVFLEKPFL